MARIRTIKPEFFRHEGLFEAERESGLPLRLAFAGLWTAADREGRFKWKPRELKLDCLPHDDVDFSRVLDALLTRGSIVKYAVDGREFGYIPSWLEHQVINNRESASVLPDPNKNNTLTREARVSDASFTRLEHASVEEKGKEEEKEISSSVAAAIRPGEQSRFDEFWTAYPRRKGDNPRKPAEAKFNSLVKTGLDPQTLIDAAKKYAIDKADKVGTEFIPMASTWLNRQQWLDRAAVATLQALAAPAFTVEDAVKQWARIGRWPRGVGIGPEPGMSGCLASPGLLAKYGLSPDGRKLETEAA